MQIRFTFLAVLFLTINSCLTKQTSKNLSLDSDEKIVSNLKLSKLFGDNMVLQQKEHVALFGTAEKHQIVIINASWGQSTRTMSDNTGQWLAKINTPKAGGPYTITISHQSESIILNDVLIGEVWLASGQSNMEMPVKGWPPNDLIDNSDEEIANGDYPQIRMFTVARKISVKPQDDLSGKWEIATPKTVSDFSATAYFFARKLNHELNVPIGIIHTSWGGTVAEAWTSKEKLLSLGDFDREINNMAEPSSEAEINNWFADKESRSVPTTAEGFRALELNDTNAPISSFEGALEISLPGRFDMIGDGDIDGAFWLYKEVMITDRTLDYDIEFGAIDDIDATYVNGQLIGGISGYNIKREYKIPSSILRRGKNLIAIRAIDTGGPGTITEPMNLNSSDGESMSLTGNWMSVATAEIYNGNFYIYDMDQDIANMRPNIIRQNPNVPAVLYNGMIHPIIPYAIKGAIWYQGESNVGRDRQYRKLFPALITDWRKRWGNSFPFYYVQIAPFQYGGGSKDQSQKLREAQRNTLVLENTGMVVTMDIGNNTNIHPGNKQDVGRRLAGLALANDYGKDIVASGPNYKSKTIDGGSIVLDFDNVGSGLTASEDGLIGFEIAGRNGRFKSAVAKIQGNQLVVSSEEVKEPIHVRYAWSDTAVASLFNQEGLPASTFSTRN